MYRRFIIGFAITICLLVTAVWSQPVQKNTPTGRTQTTVVPNQPRDKESPELMHLSATYQVDEIQFGKTGVPEYIRGDLTPRSGGGDPLQTAYTFFEDNAGLFGMTSARSELHVAKSKTDQIGMTHISFQQYYGNIPVFTGELKAHVGSDGHLRTVNGQYFAGINVSTMPAFSAASAKNAARSDLAVNLTEIRYREEPSLWIYPDGDNYYLVWQVIIDGPSYEAWRYIVDARNGRVLNRIPLTMSDVAPVRRGAAKDEQHIPDAQRLQEMSSQPLGTANSEVYFGTDGVWIRHEGDNDFSRAREITDFHAEFAQERQEQSQRAATTWGDYVLDLRRPDALALAQSMALDLQVLPQTGYYRVHTTKQVLNALSQNHIDAAVYPDLPGERGADSPNDADKPHAQNNTLDDVLFSETFEGAYPASWTVGDDDATNGLDYWDDISCQHHNAYWSGWCAATGDMTDCVNYDDYMNAFAETPATDIYGRAHMNVNWWWRNISETNYDYFRAYVRSDVSGWVLLQEHTGSSPSWQYYNSNITIGGTGAYLYLKFVFYSDFSVHSYEGAYIDDVQITADWATCGFIGIGTGMMGNWQDHVDASWTWPNYRLEDKTRCQNTWDCQHTHFGQLRNDQSIISWNQYSGTHFTDDNNAWNAPTGIDNMVYTTAYYDFLLAQFGRNSYEGTGNSMYGIVDSPGCTDNAFGGGQTITFCQPGANRRGTGGCPDVIGHEWGHSITASESNLIYQRESGALNEGFSDIIGATFGWQSGYDADWLIGENTFTNGTAWRDMENPQVYSQPDCRGGSFWYPCDVTSCPTPNNSNDQCGVHTNSGVLNRMYTLLVNGGTHNGVTVSGIGLMNAMQVVYRANCFYWTSGTDYANARSTCISAANDLNAAWVTPVTNAFAAVCVGTAVETPLNCSGAPMLFNGTAVNSTNADGEGHILNYNCSIWNESGPEKVYRVLLGDAPYTFTATLSNMTADLDIFLLSACDDNQCVAVGNSSLTYTTSSPGTWYVVVDGYYGAVSDFTLLLCINMPTPTLLGPVDGVSTCSGASGVYSWNATLPSYSYTVQWDDNTAFSSPIEQTVTGTSVSQALTGSGPWYWHVRSNNLGSCSASSWSTYRTVNLVAAPAQAGLSAPADGATVCSASSQAYTWINVAGATSYTVQWDDNNSFSSPVEQTVAGTSCSQALTGSGTWFWHVRANNACGSGIWSGTRSMALAPVPGQVALASPADGVTECSGTSYAYSWNAVTGAASYTVQWDDNNSFSSPLEQTVASTSASQAITGSGTWYWHVRANNTCGSGTWAVTRSFVLSSTPAQATLISPAAGAVIGSGAPQTYTWNALSYAATYTIQWDDNTSFSTPLEQTVAGTSASQTITGSGTWYWHVRGQNSCGTGVWSTARNFTLGSLMPPVVVISPEAANVRVAWPPVSGAISYRVEYSDNVNGSFFLVGTTADTSMVQATGANVKRFYRVIAIQ